MVSVGASALCVTSGKVDTDGALLGANVGGMRAVALGTTGSQAAELTFTFRGASPDAVPLANGEMRQQIGLKLRAKDTCNVVYVMWHVSPAPGVFVSVKSNRGQSTHAECLDRGYINLPPNPNLHPNLSVEIDRPHTLRAELSGATLYVFADGQLAWEGTLPDAAFAFDGPVGVRSDNGHFLFDLKVPNAVFPRRPSEACVTD